jgi:hypothetical protein
MALLRIVCSTSDALVSILLYGAIVRVWGDRLAGACAVAIHQLIPLDFGVLALGNLTNAFAQALSVAALAAMWSTALQITRWVPTLGFTLTLAAAFLSHSGTFAILSVACLATAVLFWWKGDGQLRGSAAAIMLSLTVAIGLAVALYYAHYLDVYRTQLARVLTETSIGSRDEAGRGILARLLWVPRYLYLYFGVPTLVLAAWGGRARWKHRQSDRLTLSILGWTAACMGFLVLGIVTPFGVRYYVALLPVVAIAAGFGASAGWTAGGYSRIAATVLLAWGLVEGVRGWWTAIG